MPDARRSPLTPLLTLSALASGTAALVLELQWGRQLALTFGGSHHAVASVLTAFMLGLGIGSFFGGRVADRLQKPALAIAAIEIALAVLGPVLGFALTRLPAFAAQWFPGVASAEHPMFTISRFVLALAVLMIPTGLMGATYPILVRASAADLDGLHRGISRLYAANTIGGVAGVLLAGLAVLPAAGISGSILVAAGANLAAAVAAFAAHLSTAHSTREATDPRRRPPATMPDRLLLAAAGSGALVLGAETIWHRALKMVLANSTITFTLLLALTLVGLGLGAVMGAPLLRRSHPMRLWSRLQFGAAVLLVAQAALLPEIATIVRLIRPDAGWARVLAPPLLVGGLLIVPATLIFGAAWPLLLKAATPRVDDGGRHIGRMGIVNSIGAAFGAAVVGLAVLPGLGFGRASLVMAGLGAGLAWLGTTTGSKTPSRSTRRLRAVCAGAATVLFAVAVTAPSFGRIPLPSMAVGADTTEVVSYSETASGVVLVTEDRRTGARAMYVDNNAVIGASYDALKVARMLGLVPTLLHPDPRRALVIGFGAGVTTATLAGSPEIEEIDVVEIVPGVIDAADHFEHLNHAVADDPRVRLHTNDGRNHLLLHPGPWDLITCDPVHPLLGSAPLYSRDFFELARGRLAPGGIVCQYLPLHKMPDDAFRRAVATFQAAFDESWILFGLGHAMFVGSNGPIELDWRRWRSVLEGHALLDDLASSALHHPAQIAALLQLDPTGCRSVAAGSPSTDAHPRLEFLAPAAYEPGLWPANARTLVEAYTSPNSRIRNLPPGMEPHLQRLVAGKRLLLFSLLARADGDLESAERWLANAIQIAGDDPEIVLYSRQFAAEVEGR